MGKGSDAFGGAMSGASTGAMIGSVGGPAGALIGGGVGAVGGAALGWFGGGGDGPEYGYDPNRDNFGVPGFQGMTGQYGDIAGQSRNAPQVGGSSFRGGQQNYINMLNAQAQGQGAGQQIARDQAQIATDRGLAQQMAMARSARPGQSAAAARNAAMASGQLQGQGAQAATMGGLQAQQAALGQLGGALGQARGQDLQRNSANAELQYKTMGLDDQRQMEALRQRLQLAGMQQQGNMGYEGAQQQRANAIYGYQANQPTAQQQAMGAIQGIGQAYMGMKAGQGQGGSGVAANSFGSTRQPNYFGGPSYASGPQGQGPLG